MALNRFTDWDNKQVIGLLMIDHSIPMTSTNRAAGVFVGQAFWLPDTVSVQKFQNVYRTIASQTLDPHLFSWDGITLSSTTEITLNIASSDFLRCS